MKPAILVLMVLCAALAFASQQSSQQPSENQPTQSGTGVLEKQENANSAAKDSTGLSGDAVSKPSSSSKNSTVIGCLEGPEADGRYILKNMQYKTGVDVSGPAALGDATGKKVKLTGEWLKNADTTPAGKAKNRSFKATQAEVLSTACKAPAEKRPVSKRKQQH